VFLIHSEPQITNRLQFGTFTSLFGISGFYNGHVFHATHPLLITNQSLHLNDLEIFAVTVIAKLWAPDFKELTLNSGKSRVPFRPSCLQASLPAQTLALSSSL